MSASTKPVTLSENVIVTGIGVTFVLDAVDDVNVTVGTTLSNVYVDVTTVELRFTMSQAIAFRVVVAAEIDTDVGCDDETVPVEQVGSTPFVV